MTHLSTERPTARKEYCCIWCNDPILKGEKHEKVAGIHEGEFQSNRFHPECFKAMQAFFAEERFEDDFSPHSFKRGTTEER